MKECFKCKTVKPLSEFYAHPQMADGYLNKCKDCNKKDVSERIAFKRATDPQWIIKERERCRKKQALYLKENGPIPQANKKVTPHKVAANILLRRAVLAGRVLKKPCEVCKNTKTQAHHEDYEKPLDVVWLCTRHHADRHIHLRDSDTLGRPAMPIGEWLQAMENML